MAGHDRDSPLRRHTPALDALPIIAWTSTADGALEDLNTAWTAYTGLSREESLAASGYLQAFHPDDRPRSAALWAQARASGEGYEIEYRICRGADGAYRWHRGRVTPLRDPDGRLIGWLGTAIDIDDRMRAEQERDRLLAEAEAIFEAAGDGMFVFDREGRLRHVNAAARRQLAIEGPLDLQMSPQYARGGIEVLDDEGNALAEPRWPLYRVLRGEVLTGPDAVDLRVRRHDGQVVDLSVTGSPIRDADGRIAGAVCVARDVGERQRLARRARDALDALLEMAQALVLPLDEEGGAPAIGGRLAALAQRVLACRRLSITAIEAGSGVQHPLAAVGLTPEQERYWRSDTEGRPLFETGGDALIADIVARIQEGEVFVFDLARSDWGDRPNPYGVRTLLVAPMRVAGVLVGVLSLDYGAEDQTFSQEELSLAGATARLAALVIERDRLLAEREAARAGEVALRETNRRMDEFLAVVSHELRTPLTGLRTSLQVLQRRLQRAAEPGASGEPAPTLGRSAPLLDRALRQSGVLTGLVDDLLDLSRIQAGQLRIDLGPCDLAALVERVVAEQRDLAPARAISLRLPAGGKICVAADEGRLGQVLTNFLTNALKYSEPDRPIAVGLEVAGSQARVWVRDAGPGIPLAHQGRIWERFQRVGGSSIAPGRAWAWASASTSAARSWSAITARSASRVRPARARRSGLRSRCWSRRRTATARADEASAGGLCSRQPPMAPPRRRCPVEETREPQTRPQSEIVFVAAPAARAHSANRRSAPRRSRRRKAPRPPRARAMPS